MSDLTTICSIQREYFELIRSVLPRNLYESLLNASRTGAMAELAERLARPILYTATGQKVSSLEVAFDEVARLLSAFWRERADPLLRALENTPLYGVTLETQRFPSRLPTHLRRLALYFDCVGMVDLLHIPHTDALEELLRDPEKRQVKIEMLLWFVWMVRASEVATIDPNVPVFVPLPNTLYNPTANSQMVDFAAQYLADHVPSLREVASSDALDDFLDSNATTDLDTTVCAADAFSRLAARFGDDDGFAFSPFSGEVVLGAPQKLTGASQIYRIHRLLGTTFSCARETVLASLPIGWDPVLYERNAFLHEWLFAQASTGLATQKDNRNIQPEQAAVCGLVGNDLEFLEAVSAEDIRRVREGELYKELRDLLSLSRAEFKIAAHQSPEAAVQAFVTHVRDAINQFATKYKEVNQDRKSARWRAALNFTGATSLTALTIAFPSLALLGWLAGGVSVLVGGKSLLDLADMEKEASRRKKELETNPLMLLYRASTPSADA
jgi:hypothetical protein